jgi:hypothetical protein
MHTSTSLSLFFFRLLLCLTRGIDGWLYPTPLPKSLFSLKRHQGAKNIKAGHCLYHPFSFSLSLWLTFPSLLSCRGLLYLCQYLDDLVFCFSRARSYFKPRSGVCFTSGFVRRLNEQKGNVFSISWIRNWVLTLRMLMETLRTMRGERKGNKRKNETSLRRNEDLPQGSLSKVPEM